MPTRTLFIVGGVAVGLCLVIWLTAIVFDSKSSDSHGQRRKTVVCMKEQELSMSSQRVCIYACENGEKSRIVAVDKCAKSIEM